MVCQARDHLRQEAVNTIVPSISMAPPPFADPSRQDFAQLA